MAQNGLHSAKHHKYLLLILVRVEIMKKSEVGIRVRGHAQRICSSLFCPWSVLSCCPTNASFQLGEIWSGASDEQGSSLIIRPDGWGPELGREEEERDEGGGALDKSNGERWRVSGKERVVERDLQETQWRESNGEKDECGETCRQLRRRIHLTNYLLLHYKGCQPVRLCQLSCTLMPVSVARACKYTPVDTSVHTYSLYLHRCFLKNRMHTHAETLPAVNRW